MADSLQVKLQRASAEFQKLQSDLSNAVEARQRLDAQLSENELVKKVFQASYFLAIGLLIRSSQGIRAFDS